MRRWLPTLSVLFLAAIAALAIRHVLQERAQEKREVIYQSSLRSYSAALKPGVTRKSVEEYLGERNVPFQRMCCVDYNSTKQTYDDLAKIGQEDAPWFCSQNNVYIAFQFSGSQFRHPGEEALPSDILRAVTIFHWLEGCM